MIIALACYSNEDMPELLAQYSYISNLREEMMELFCSSGISTLNTKFNISLLLVLLAYSTQNQKTQMCDYIIINQERQGSRRVVSVLERVDHFWFNFYEGWSKIHSPGQKSIFRIRCLI